MKALVLGGLGTIGSAVADGLATGGFEVVRTARSPEGDSAIPADPFRPGGLAALDPLGPFDAVVWAQGANTNDSVLSFDYATFRRVMEANCDFVALSLAHLLEAGRISDGARLCVISSIWQNLARPRKFSYTVAKAAVAGLVRSAAVDLADRGILVNAVLPSVTDTRMTRAMLSDEQIAAFEDATPFKRLTSLSDTVQLVAYLCSPQNTGVTGQSVAVDLGYSVARLV